MILLSRDRRDGLHDPAIGCRRAAWVLQVEKLGPVLGNQRAEVRGRDPSNLIVEYRPAADRSGAN